MEIGQKIIPINSKKIKIRKQLTKFGKYIQVMKKERNERWLALAGEERKRRAGAFVLF